MNENIKPAEMIEWFKTKANEFNRIAKVLESTFSATGQPLIQSQPISKIVNADEVKTALATFNKTTRSSAIAEYLKTDQSAVLTILSGNPNLFEQVGRGWWKNK
jgi:hypothetical protein